MKWVSKVILSLPFLVQALVQLQAETSLMMDDVMDILFCHNLYFFDFFL